MYTGVNDIMRLERGPGSSLNDELLAACLKALTIDQFSAELVMLPASCGAICMDQAARTALLATMPTLDEVDIAVVQRGDLSRGVTIPGATVTGGRGVLPVAAEVAGQLVAAGDAGAQAALALLQPSARAREYRCGSSMTTTRYRTMRMNPCRRGYGRCSWLAGPAVLAPLRPMWW
jgi:hypothetical protein